MSRLFQAEHFETAKQVGIDHFSDAWGEASAEIGLTIPKLVEKYGEFGITLQDLQGYHFLHYGTDPEIVQEASQIISGNNYDWDWILEARDILPAMLEKKRLTLPLELGRISVNEAHVASDINDVFDETIISGGRLGQRRFGKFLTPVEGVNAYFTGRTTIDLFEQNPQGYLKNRGGFKEIISSLCVHTDHICLKNGENEAMISAHSFSEDGRSKLIKVVEANPFEIEEKLG